MKIEERQQGDVVILDLKGKLLIGEGDELLRDKVESLLAAGHKKIGLDLSDVPYVDSAGLGEIVRAYTNATRHDAKLKVLNPSKRIRDLLAVTRLTTLLGGSDEEDWGA